MIGYLKQRRILKLTVLKAAIEAGMQWDVDNPPASKAWHDLPEYREQAKKAAVLLAKCNAELDFLAK